MKTIIINPVGEPGSGKSTFSFWLTYALKTRGVLAEYVPEAIKPEFYSPEGIERVMSGNFDKRTVLRQHGMIKPLLGRVEVIVNDGTLPVFNHYWAMRLDPKRLADIEALLATLMAEQSGYDHRYVSVERMHDYDPQGRRQSEEEAADMRKDLLDMLAHKFDIHPQPVGGQASREAFLDALVADVVKLRQAPTRNPKP